MKAIASYRGNRPTHTQTHTPTYPQTDRTDYNTLRRFWDMECQKCRDLEIWVRSHSQSSKMIPIDPAHRTSY